MATIEKQAPERTRVAGYALVGIAAIGAVAIAVHYFTRPPQMGTDEEAFKTVDALYTAVRMKDEAKVAQCEQRLHSYREAGKLGEKPAAHLDGVIALTRKGEWDSAVERLYEFMLAQRREGRSTQPEEKPVKKAKK